MFDYEQLRLIWWVLIGVLLIGFAVTDGFDMGSGILSLIVGKNDTERRVIINTMAPHWEGNQVWFVTAGGAIFAAWPQVYSTAFSGFYAAMFLTLAALFFRPVGFDYRGKLESPKWRSNWDKLLFIGSIVPPIIFGVAFGNLFLGVAFDLDRYLRASFGGGFFSLLHPFAILCGLVSLFMLITQGAAWLGMKTEGDLKKRIAQKGILSAMLTSVLFVIAGLWVSQLDGYTLTHLANINGDSNPLDKVVSLAPGGWLNNYHHYPIMMLAPLLGILLPILTALLIKKGRDGFAFLSSSLSSAAIIITAGCSLFPFIMPSSMNPSHSLTIWDATSSYKTLSVMTFVAAVFVPIILCYTSWTYYKMFGRIKQDDIESNSHSFY
jgi:cytochrome d ubiquinol oxidase subunit II